MAVAANVRKGGLWLLEETEPASVFTPEKLSEEHRLMAQTVEEFVTNSQKRWRESVPDTKIEKSGEVERSGGQPAYVSYRYENPSRPQQRFEAVSFGIDSDKDGNDFFVMIAVTGRDKKAIDQALASYNAFLKAH